MPASMGEQRLSPGFAEPVRDAQRAFRSLLEAFSYPGRIVQLGLGIEAPAPLGRAAAAACLTLLDYETPAWLDCSRESAAGTWLRFHCGCPLVADPGAARFAVTQAANLPRLAALDAGEHEFPDRSATVIVEADCLESGTPVRLTGPGIKGAAALSVAGLPDWFWADWRANGALFPRGVDVLLTAGSRLVGLPRTIGAEV